MTSSLAGRCFLSILDFDPEDLRHNLQLAAAVKRRPSPRSRGYDVGSARGHLVALLFEKPSLRTRSTFEIAIRELGGDFIDPSADVALGKRESLADVGRSLERWVAGAIVRTFEQARLVDLATATKDLRIVNALSNEGTSLPGACGLLDTPERWSTPAGRRVAFVGDGNNVATSFIQAATMLGISVHVASPVGFDLPTSVDDDVTRIATAGAELVRFR